MNNIKNTKKITSKLMVVATNATRDRNLNLPSYKTDTK